MRQPQQNKAQQNCVHNSWNILYHDINQGNASYPLLTHWRYCSLALSHRYNCQPHWMGHGQHHNRKWIWMVQVARIGNNQLSISSLFLMSQEIDDFKWINLHGLMYQEQLKMSKGNFQIAGICSLTPLLEAANWRILAMEPRFRRWSLLSPLYVLMSTMSKASGATMVELM